eukprot:gene11087-12255_t
MRVEDSSSKVDLSAVLSGEKDERGENKYEINHAYDVESDIERGNEVEDNIKNGKDIEMNYINSNQQADPVATEMEGQLTNGNSPEQTNTTNAKKDEEPIKQFRYADAIDILLMIWGTIFGIANGIVQPASVILFGDLIDDFIKFSQRGSFDIEGEMKKFAVYYVYFAVGSWIAAYVHTAFWSLASVRQAKRIRTKCFNRIIRQDIGWFDVKDAGELSTRITEDVTKVQNGIGDKVGMLIHSVSMFLASFVIGFIYSWKLTLVMLAVTPLMVIVTALTGIVISRLTSQEQTAYAKAGGVASEVLGAIHTVVAFGGEGRELSRYTSCLGESEKAGVKKGFNSGLAFGLFQLVQFACYALSFWYGSELIIDGDITAGDLMIVFFCVIIGATQIGQAAPNLQDISVGRGAAYYVYNLMEQGSSIDPMSEVGIKPDITGNIEFHNVDFTYPSRLNNKILTNFNVTIDSGATVALVGESGCGKSTIVKLVQRFYDATAGSVFLDGINLKEINVPWLRQHIGVVSQEPVLFEGTIAQNIRMGKTDATDEEIEQAVKDANAYGFISELPEKFETQVGEGGAQLSGGQKQRIAIARALVRDPKILLLDEATSALDTESESIVQAALDKASEGRTTIVVAHRLSTIKNADVIIVMQDGCVVETGTHDYLIGLKRIYYSLVMLQTIAEKVAENEDQDNLSLLSQEDRVQRMAFKIMRSVSQSEQNDEESIKQIERALHKNLPVEETAGKRKKQPEKEKKKAETEEEKDEDVEMPPMKRLMKLNLPEWPYLLIASIFAAIAGAFPVAFAIIMSELIKVFSYVDTTEMRKKAEFWSLMFLVIGVVGGVSIFIANYLFAKAGEILTRRLRELCFKAILRQEIAFFDEVSNSSGALCARLSSDASGVQGATSTRLSTIVQVTVMGLSAIIVSFVYQWHLTLLIFAFIPLLVFAGAMYTTINTSFAAKEKEASIKSAAVASETILNIRTVASLGKEEHFYRQYESLLAEPHKKSLANSHLFGISFGLSYSTWFFVNSAAFRLGGYLVKHKGVEFDAMFKVVFALVFAAMFAGQVASFAPSYIKAKVSAARIFRLLDRVPPIDTYSTEGDIIPDFNGSITLKNLFFNYPTRQDVPVLTGLSVTINPGQTLALVGASGCGKSTVISLLERFYDVAEGSLEIHGRDIKDLNLAWLRSQIGLVSQEPVLFNCSIKENITYGLNSAERNQISDDQITSAAISANIHHFISTLPQGYETQVGEKGTLISGGQKQRIAIARALIRNPKVLLLDEATSALDSESEKVVQQALDTAMEGRTSIVIAHRLSTIQNADIIAVVQGGKIIEIGNHHELMELQKAYYILNSAQV